MTPTPEMIEAAARAVCPYKARPCPPDKPACEECAAKGEAVLTAALSVGWRGIESAPKDGTKFLACIAGEPDVGICSRHDPGRTYDSWVWDLGNDDPTHWQPLPPPPERKDG